MTLYQDLQLHCMHPQCATKSYYNVSQYNKTEGFEKEKNIV